MYLDVELPFIRKNQLLASGNAIYRLCEAIDVSSAPANWTLMTNITLMNIQISLLKRRDLIGHPLDYGNLKMAYIVHTSGSTGLPKVVSVPHLCIVPNILDMRLVSVSLYL